MDDLARGGAGRGVPLPASRADAQRDGRRAGSDEQYFAPVGPNDFYKPPAFSGNVPYDGRVTFARIKYRG